MDFLKEWIRGLVLLVILATCLELLVPMGSMKKYVRMVMGLLVMLAVLNPILTFLGQEVTVDTSVLAVQTSGRLPTVGEIMVQAQEFREKNEALMLDQARVRLADEARAAAGQVAGVAEARAAVRLKQQGSELIIEAVTVTVVPGERAGAVKPVKPVEPVRVGEGAPARALTQAEQALADKVRQEVAARLGLKPEDGAIRVLVESQRR